MVLETGNFKIKTLEMWCLWKPTSWLTEVIFLLCPPLKKQGCGGNSLGFLLENESERYSVMSDSLWTHGLYSPWNSPGQDTGVGSLSLLHGTSPTQGSNPGLLHCRQMLYQLKGILQNGSALNLVSYQRPQLLVSSTEVRTSKYVWGSQIFSLSTVEADTVSDRICVWHLFFLSVLSFLTLIMLTLVFEHLYRRKCYRANTRMEFS